MKTTRLLILLALIFVPQAAFAGDESDFFMDNLKKSDLIDAFKKDEFEPFDMIFVKDINQKLRTPGKIAVRIGTLLSGFIPFCIFGFSATLLQSSAECIATTLAMLAFASLIATPIISYIAVKKYQQKKVFLEAFKNTLLEWEFFIEKITPEEYKDSISDIYNNWYSDKSNTASVLPHDYVQTCPRRLFTKEGMTFIKKIRKLINNKKNKDRVSAFKWFFSKLTYNVDKENQALPHPTANNEDT